MVGGSCFLDSGAVFKDLVDFGAAKVGSNLQMREAIFEDKLNLNSTRVSGSAFLSDGSHFKGKVNFVSAKIGANLEMQDAIFEDEVNLNSIDVTSSAFLDNGSLFKKEVNIGASRIGSNLQMRGATFEGLVSLNRILIEGTAFFDQKAVFHDEINLGSSKIGSALVMRDSRYEKDISLNRAQINGNAFLDHGSVFRGTIDLISAQLGGLEMSGATFEADVNLNSINVSGVLLLGYGALFKQEIDIGSAKIGSALVMRGSTFEKRVNMNRAKIAGTTFLDHNSVFESEVDSAYAKMGSSLRLLGSLFHRRVDLTGTKIEGDLLLGVSEETSVRWEDDASLILRNTRVETFQDWWQSITDNAWPQRYELEGFTYERLGSVSGMNEADMLDRSAKSYVEWLGKDVGASTQPYEQLANLFRDAGEPYKSTDILYAARERLRRSAWSKTDEHGLPKNREYSYALGLFALRVTIGYGLGNRYFRVLWWVIGFTLLGAGLLISTDTFSLAHSWQVIFTSLDQLLPVISLDQMHDKLIFGDASVKPAIDRQPYWLRIYFYFHKIAGWILGSFLVAGLAGLTQRK